MDKKTEKNKLNNQKNNNALAVQDSGSVKRGRGRPKGTKNKAIRADHADNVLPGENAKMLRYSLALSNLPKIDYDNIEQVKQRLQEYYNISVEYDSKPSVACLALAFGMDRFNLFNVLNGKSNKIKNIDCIYTIKTAYSIITSHYEQMMNNGKINPVSGIFLMKNNFGYKDNVEYTVLTEQNNNVNDNDIYNRANLLD